MRRIELTCDAVARIIDVPIEAAGFDALLREAIRVRHAWIRSAFDQLECCNNGVSAETDAGNADTSGLVAELSPEAVNLMRQHGASVSETPVLNDEAIGIEIATEKGWLLSADGLSPVLLAPFDQNRSGLLGLGPQRWQLGAAVRVRRLRNPEPIDVDEASNRFRALVTQQGSVTMVEQISIDGLSALRHILDVPYQSWSATVTVFVAGDFTYFVETGCPSGITGACESVEAVAGSLTLLP